MIFKYRWAIAAVIVICFSGYLYLSFKEQTSFVNKVESNKKQSSLEQTDTPPHYASIVAVPTFVFEQEQKPHIALGLRLFLDPQLSSNGEVSCESCHHIYDNGAEDIRVSKGVKGEGNRNSPTVFNIGLNTRFFWDGRANSLYEQIDGPIHNPLEMNSNWGDIAARLSSQASYQSAFAKHYDEVITEDTIKDALITFMMQLNTPGAPFDKYLKGEANAMPQAAILGWEKFQDLGCIYCHQGRNIGGNLFQKFGSVEPVETLNSDLGRYQQTNDINDKYVYRVPSLRNVALTPPYFHDGRAQSLEEAVLVMAKVQLGKDLEATTVVELIAFLDSLTAPNPPILKELRK
ncbi:Cytochrome c peroxidase [Shewanella piezotolerans WP3]|uniref:Cytochrome c peroxidase n=1 Tax=Shewanella piezotolerans (strain WP3 / JCM 13877) TaxID=225849 RepID=B8CUQ6_SHEPW|nr:cytochrome c peroxidase [Shewanella piezotolerans]ACJ31248.1 Cytochrome c peroxidase [Shewanella piezotolerans WP3]